MQCKTLSALWMPVFPLQYDFTDIIKLPLVENDCSNLTKADFSQAKPNDKVRNQERVTRGGGRGLS